MNILTFSTWFKIKLFREEQHHRRLHTEKRIQYLRDSAGTPDSSTLGLEMPVIDLLTLGHYLTFFSIIVRQETHYLCYTCHWFFSHLSDHATNGTS